MLALSAVVLTTLLLIRASKNKKAKSINTSLNIDMSNLPQVFQNFKV